MYEAAAETPKATDPTRLSRVIHHDRLWGDHADHPWHTSNQASPLAVRKHPEPRASGRHTWWLAARWLRWAWTATPVLTLKKRVPTSWMPLAHQSSWPGR